MLFSWSLVIRCKKRPILCVASAVNLTCRDRIDQSRSSLSLRHETTDRVVSLQVLLHTTEQRNRTSATGIKYFYQIRRYPSPWWRLLKGANWLKLMQKKLRTKTGFVKPSRSFWVFRAARVLLDRGGSNNARVCLRWTRTQRNIITTEAHKLTN